VTQKETGGWIAPTAGFQISDDLTVLEHAKHDGSDKGESRISGHNAQLADKRTGGHRDFLLGQKKADPHNVEASDPFLAKKVRLAVRAPHRRGAITAVMWLKSCEIKALMSP